MCVNLAGQCDERLTWLSRPPIVSQKEDMQDSEKAYRSATQVSNYIIAWIIELLMYQGSNMYPTLQVGVLHQIHNT